MHFLLTAISIDFDIPSVRQYTSDGLRYGQLMSRKGYNNDFFGVDFRNFPLGKERP